MQLMQLLNSTFPKKLALVLKPVPFEILGTLEREILHFRQFFVKTIVIKDVSSTEAQQPV